MYLVFGSIMPPPGSIIPHQPVRGKNRGFAFKTLAFHLFVGYDGGEGDV